MISLLASVLRAQVAPLPVRVGVLLLSNSQADQALRLAVENINQLGLRDPAGREFQLELVYPRAYPRSPEDMSRTVSDFQAQAVHAVIGPASNDLALPNLETLVRAGIPVLTLATVDPLTDFDVTNNILRFRAAESFYSFAAADYLLNELGLTRIALVQTDIISTEGLISFEVSLLNAAREAVLKIQLEDNSQLEEQIPLIISSNPEALAMWGPAADAARLHQELRARGWNGVFFYRHAQEAAQRKELSNTQGILGAAGWSYTTPTGLSRRFLLDFVTRYGAIPMDEAAAAYDAAFVLASQIQRVGFEMPVIYETFLQMPLLLTVQGSLDPQSYGNGDFSRIATVYELNQFGAPQIRARYANQIRLPEEDSDNLNVVAAIGTPTFTPSPSPSPTTTLLPSATPSQAQLTALGEVSIYAGPGRFFEELGVLVQGTSATVIGGNADLSWLVIQYRGGIAWVENDLTQISTFDPSNLFNQLPIIDAPPTPIGGASPTPASQLADIIIEDVVLTPPKLIPGQPFIANVVLRNIGASPTGLFTVATVFEPGTVYSSNFVPNIDPNSTITIPLSATLTGSGQFTIGVVADINNEVDEGPNGELNNLFPLTYIIDFPIVNEAVGLGLPAGGSADMDGGAADIRWTGSSFEVLNGAQLGIITGVTYENVNHTILSSGVIAGSQSVSDGQIFPGVLIGIRTAEGRFGVVRVEARDGTGLLISYRVYGS